MSILRFTALEKVLDRKPNWTLPPEDKISDFFGRNVFNVEKMREYLSQRGLIKVL